MKGKGYFSSIELGSGDCFDPQSCTWEPLPPMPVRRASTVGAVLAGRLYICGRLGDFGQSVVRFNPRRRKWESVPSMSTPRAQAAVAVIGWRLYICGGQSLTQTWNSVECFDPRSARGRGSWESLQGMSVPRRGLSATAIADQLYVCGGFDLPTNQDHLSTMVTYSSVERFDPAEGVWRAFTPMLSPRGLHAAVALKGRLYVCGGWDHCSPTSTMEYFDPILGRWFSSTHMLSVRIAHSATVVAGRIYVCGGWQTDAAGAPAESSVENFDPERGTWEGVRPMPRRRGAFCVACIAGGTVTKT